MPTPAWRDKKGFTLVEVLVAMMIMGIGILGFMALQTAAVTTRVQARNMTTATELTSSLLDELMRMRPDVLLDDSRSRTRTISSGGRSYTQNWIVLNNQPVGGLITITAQTSWSDKSRTRSVSLSAVVGQQ